MNLERSMLTDLEKDVLKGKEWMIKLVAEMEKEFIEFHGPATSDFNRSDGVNKILSSNIQKKLNCDMQVAQCFVKTRLSMRIRDHNMPIRNASLNCTNKSYSKYYS
jgi:hypothetical protein